MTTEDQTPQDSPKKKVAANLSNRSRNHRIYALIYTIAIFITIGIAIYIYYRFQQSKLEELQQSTEVLKKEYSSVLVEINNSNGELKQDLSDTKLFLTTYYDSMMRQQSRTDRLIKSINSKMVEFEADTEITEIFALESELDSLIRQYENLGRLISSQVGEWEFGFSQLHVLMRLQLADSTDLLRVDIAQHDKTRHLINSISMQLEGIEMKEILRSNTSTSLFNSSLISLKESVGRLSTDLERHVKNLNTYSRQLMTLRSSLSDFGKSNALSVTDQNLKNQAKYLKAISAKLNMTANHARELQVLILELRKATGNFAMFENSPGAILREINFSIQNGLNRADSLQRRYNDFSKAMSNHYNSSSDFYGDLPTLIGRYGLVIFLVYVIQMLLSYAKYHYRLASFYDSKGDVLLLRDRFDDIKTEDLIKLMDASQVNFGRSENIYKKLYEYVKDFTQKK